LKKIAVMLFVVRVASGALLAPLALSTAVPLDRHHHGYTSAMLTTVTGSARAVSIGRPRPFFAPFAEMVFLF